MLAEVAESFAAIEQQQVELTRNRAAAAGIADFLAVYRRYAAIVALRAADGLRSAQSAWDEAQRQVRVTAGELAAATATSADVVGRLAGNRAAIDAGEGEREALRTSPEMRRAEELERRKTEAAAAGRRAGSDAVARDQAEARRLRLDQRRAEVARMATAAGSAATATRDLVGSNAAAVGLAAVAERLPPAGLTPAMLEPLAGELEARRVAAAQVRTLLKSALAADRAREAFAAVAAAANARLGEAGEALTATEGILAQQREAWTTAAEAWLDALTVLVIPEAARAAADGWAQDPVGDEPLAAAAATAALLVHTELAGIEAGLAQRERALKAERDLLVAEAEALRAGVDQPPPLASWRDQAPRADRPGASLWACCDFAAEVDPSARAGYEAALQAAGLLDAWIAPDGTIEVCRDGDAVLLGDLPPVADHLGSVLVPALDRANAGAAALNPAAVARAIAGIGCTPGDGPAWVSADGRFRLGPLVGAWSKPAAGFIGAGARARARAERLVIVSAAIAVADAGMDALASERAASAARRTLVEGERRGVPVGAARRAARAQRAPAAQAVDRARTAAVQAQQRELAAQQAAVTAHAACRAHATAVGLADWVDSLDRFDLALRDLHHGLVLLARDLRSEAGAQADLALATAEAARQADEVARFAQVAAASASESTRLDAEALTLEAIAGAESQALVARLGGLEVRLRGLAATAVALDDKRSAAIAAQARADERVAQVGALAQTADATRDAAVTHLRAILATGIVAALDDAPPLSVGDATLTALLDHARALARSHEGTARDEPARDRALSAVQTQLQGLQVALAEHGYQPGGATRDGVFLVGAYYRGVERPLSAIRALLDTDIAEQQAMLSAREREVIENTLIDEVAAHLHRRLHDAEAWVEATNRELAERPMSTGMALRFRWEPDPEGPETVRAARDRLLRLVAAWSPEDRAAVGEFLHGRIRAERLADPGGAWHELLAKALDYRQWHRFAVERRSDGRWQRLTRRTHGTGSGGEKAVALTVPQFAAASAHYRASPLAPRLILLDEAFVGIDADMREKCMGLLATFDLDVVMTSEREWGCYPTVPGLAIYQLATLPGIDAVAATRWVWNGRSLAKDATG